MLSIRPLRGAGAADAAADTGVSSARTAAELFFTSPRAVVVYKPARRLAQPVVADEERGEATPTAASERAPRVFRVEAPPARSGDEPLESGALAAMPSEQTGSNTPPRRRRRVPDARRPGDVHHVVLATHDGAPMPGPATLEDGAKPEVQAQAVASYAGVCRALGDLQSTLQAVRHARQWQAQLRRLVHAGR